MSELEPSTNGVSAGAAVFRRLGRNVNGYLGETIDLPEVLRECTAAARGHGWTVAEVPVSAHLSLTAFTRAGRITEAGQAAAHESSPRVYISTGIHGDEPAGPLTVLQLLRENQWPAGFSLWLCPCLNPSGFQSSRRENAQGIDLNRQYLQPEAGETVAHIRWLEQQPAFDLCLCLHEDWESLGFYIYELNPDDQPSLAELMVQRVSAVCPIDPSELIEGRPARQGIIRPSIDPRDRPQWPESFYLLSHKTRLSYTLEAPSDFALASRVAALKVATKAALQTLEDQLRSRLNRPVVGRVGTGSA